MFALCFVLGHTHWTHNRNVTHNNSLIGIGRSSAWHKWTYKVDFYWEERQTKLHEHHNSYTNMCEINWVNCVCMSTETPGKCGSLPEELGVCGHSRTSSYASQQSKVSGRLSMDFLAFLAFDVSVVGLWWRWFWSLMWDACWGGSIFCL